MHKYFLPIMALALLISGCGVDFSTPGMATPIFITSTLPASPPPASTQAPQPLTAMPTSTTVEGTTSTQLNVRREPSTAGTPLGMIGPAAKVQIIGKDSNGKWYQIAYSQAPDGKGWVTAQYVDVKDKDAIPVIGAAPNSGSGPSGVVIQQVNVRSGPGTTFNALGTLNPNDIVTLTGKDPTGVWFQIAFANGPEGKGWVTAAYLQANGVENLPIIGQTGVVVGTGTPTGVPPTITPTLVAAPQDNDSQNSPGANIIFTPSGAGSLIYSSDVSAPQGDPEDWVGFTSYTANVSVSLTCSGNGQLKVELLQNNALQPLSEFVCGQTRTIPLSPGRAYLIRLLAASTSAGLGYVRYTLAIKALP